MCVARFELRRVQIGIAPPSRERAPFAITRTPFRGRKADGQLTPVMLTQAGLPTNSIMTVASATALAVHRARPVKFSCDIDFSRPCPTPRARPSPAWLQHDPPPHLTASRAALRRVGTRRN